MKADIHPEYHKVDATCVCGNVIKTGSVRDAIKLDICSACHPFFSGVQKLIDAEGRVEQFNKRFANFKGKPDKKEKPKKKGKEEASAKPAPAAPAEPAAAEPASAATETSAPQE